MKNFFNFFLANNGLYGIIFLVLLVFCLLILRIINIKTIPKDKVNVIQASELRADFVLTRDQYQLKIYQVMNQKSNIIIVGAHNLQGQKDDFKLLSNLCQQQQWSLIAFDRRGLGKNTNHEKFRSLKTDINDIKDVVNAIKLKYPHHKIILFGEAIGATIASYACKNNSQVAGLIISNLITKHHLYPFSAFGFFKLLFAFCFNRNIKLSLYLDPKEVSNNDAYITNMNQRYTLKQI